MSESTHTHGAPSPLAVASIFRGKRLFIIGGTGFLGKVWLSMVLCRYPEIGHIYLMVRPKEGLDPQTRFLSEILPSPVFDPLRGQHAGEAFHHFVASKVTPVPGDIESVDLGLPEVVLSALTGNLDAVVNVAGLVDFNPPLDEALNANAFGINNLVNFAKKVGNIPIFHTSTCYVAGVRNGVIPELDPREYPFPRADVLDRSHWSPQREIEECVDMVNAARHRCDDAFRQSAFLDEAKQELLKAGEPTRGPALEEKLKQVKRRFVRRQLSGAGVERAEFWGWPNTYTYTKSIGEQVLLGSGVRATIFRPAVVESSIEFPFPGWNEGINTSTPLIMMILKGHVQVPTTKDSVLDIIPVDMVCAGMLASLAALLVDEAKPVYQCGTSDVNPGSMFRMIELCGLYKRRRYRAGRGNPVVDYIQSSFEAVPVSKETYQRQGAGALSRIAKGAASFLRKVSKSAGPVGGVFKAAAGAAEGYSKIANVSGSILDVFLPFIHDNNYEFRCDNLRELFARIPAEERDRLVFYPDKIDWRHYFLEVHIPGLEKWVEDDLNEKFSVKEKASRRYEDLWSMLEEMVERHDLAVALQRLDGEDLWRLTYRDVLQQATSCAARLFEMGVKPNDRVVLSGKNHPSWPIAYFGILRAGATVVPVDPDLDPHALANIVNAAHAKVALLDAHVETRAGAVLREQCRPLALLNLKAATQPGAGSLPKVVLEADDVASLIFTSGTTGTPKGVMLSHKNFTALLSSLTPVFPLNTGDGALSVLPLHHTFEFTCGLLLPLSRGARITYLDELNGERLAKAFKVSKITAMVGVPALWQLLERRITGQINERGAAAKAIFDFAASLNRTLGQKTGLDAGRILFGTVHSALGGHLRYMVSGGAALPEDTHKLFQGLGLHLAEGYGLTEAAPVLTVAKGSPKEKAGHVGKAIPGVQIKIHNPDTAGVGEVWAKGENVMVGYADNPDATAQSITEDGWLRTGDLGKLDRKGRLTIVGRAKEVIVSANGENVYPDDVEALLGTPKHIKELSIVGIPAPRGGERVACLAVPVMEDGVDRATRLARAEDSLRRAIRELSPSLRPAVVQLYDADLPRTATRKIKRKECREIVERIIAATEAQESAIPGESSEELHSPVRHAIAKVTGVAEKDIHAHSHLDQDLGFDSLMRTELATALDALRKRNGLPPIDGQKLLQAVTVSDVEAEFDRTHSKHESPTKKIHDEPPAPITLPIPVRETLKDWMRSVQLGFYDKVMRTEVIGRANIPQNRPVIAVSNHCSHLDLGALKFALGPYGNDVVTLGAKDYFFNPSKRWTRAYFENLTNVVPVDRQLGGKQSLDVASKAVGEGKPLLIFPEGTRSTSGMMSDFKPGIGYLALDHWVDILPMHIEGSYEAMPKNARLPSKRDLTVRIGPPLDAATMRQKVEGMRPEEAARAIAYMAQKAVEALRDRKPFDLQKFDPRQRGQGDLHPMEALFSQYLQSKFVPGVATRKIRYYFSLGEDSMLKWGAVLDDKTCVVKKGKPEGDVDCVIKTNPVLMEKIIRYGFVPDPSEFIAGTIKTSDLELLQQFSVIFNLSEPEAPSEDTLDV
jgi:long-chain acyl-CoA synthetase